MLFNDRVRPIVGYADDNTSPAVAKQLLDVNS